MRKKILIADDSPTIRKFVTLSLKMNGFDILSASDGMEALELLPSNKVDLIITDLNMPNLDGFELIKSVRENENYREVPIIILSSLDRKDDIERGLNYGADSYLIKPFNQKIVLYEISKYIN
jgi:two-component system chemotaxis response regulator CheY